MKKAKAFGRVDFEIDIACVNFILATQSCESIVFQSWTTILYIGKSTEQTNYRRNQFWGGRHLLLTNVDGLESKPQNISG